MLTRHRGTWLPGWFRCLGSDRLRPCSSSPEDLHTLSCWWRRGNRAAELLPCHERCQRILPTSPRSAQHHLCVSLKVRWRAIWFICRRNGKKKALVISVVDKWGGKDDTDRRFNRKSLTGSFKVVYLWTVVEKNSITFKHLIYQFMTISTILPQFCSDSIF